MNVQLSLPLLLFSIPSTCICQSSASLIGAIKSDSGKPIPSAVVSYHRVPALTKVMGRTEYAPGEAMISAAVVAAADGTFTLDNLPGGRYIVCVDVPASAYLDSCMWSGSMGLDLVQGEISSLNVVLRMGVFLRVHLNDPEFLLPPANSNPLQFPGVRVGVVVGEGGYWAAEESSVSSSGRDFLLAIPTNVPLRLWASSPLLSFSDASGAIVDYPGSHSVFQALSDTDKAFTLTVSRAAPVPGPR